MSTPPSAADKHPPAHAPRDREEKPVEEESLPHHAQRLVQSRLRTMVNSIINPCIALLQRLRKRTGEEESGEGEGEDEKDRPKHKRAKPHGNRDTDEPADEADAEAPKPRRRLLTYLIYFSIFLVGGMAGGALAYEMLAKLLTRQSADIQRLETAVAKQTKSAASNQKKLEEAEVKRADAEKKLEEAKKKQVEAEKKLETSLKDVKSGEDKQKKFDEAAKLLDSIRDKSGNAQRPPAGSEGKVRPPKSGDCTFAPGDVKSLKDCVREFNR